MLARDGEAFLLQGYDPGFAFIGLEQAGAIEEDAPEQEAEDGDIDFSMM